MLDRARRAHTRPNRPVKPHPRRQSGPRAIQRPSSINEHLAKVCRTPPAAGCGLMLLIQEGDRKIPPPEESEPNFKQDIDTSPMAGMLMVRGTADCFGPRLVEGHLRVPPIRDAQAGGIAGPQPPPLLARRCPRRPTLEPSRSCPGGRAATLRTRKGAGVTATRGDRGWPPSVTGRACVCPCVRRLPLARGGRHVTRPPFTSSEATGPCADP